MWVEGLLIAVIVARQQHLHTLESPSIYFKPSSCNISQLHAFMTAQKERHCTDIKR